MSNTILRTLMGMVTNNNVIVIHRSVVEFLEGNFDAARLFEQLLYWTDKSNDGWIAKSNKDWEAEIYIKRRTLEKAVKYLVSRNLIEVEVRKWAGAPTKHYKVNLDELERQWIEFIDGNCTDEQMDLYKSTNPTVQKYKSLTKNTTKNTTVKSANADSQGENNKPKTNTNLYHLALALSEVCAVDFNANKGQLFREAKWLNKADATPEEVRKDFQRWWYANDFRGKRGQKPLIHQVRQVWGRWKKLTKRSSDDYDDEMIEEIAAQLENY